jgi:CubicO group peptidase (beta-lactamase class C family)
MNTQATLSIVPLAFLILATVATADDAALGRKIDEHLRQREQQGFSGVFLITRHGETILDAAYGFRDAQAEAPMRTTDVFDIGSITKPITRLAILKLEAEGRLSTADLISKHFDDVPQDKQAITIQHVLDHRAGFPDTFGDDYSLITRDEMRRTILQAPSSRRSGNAATTPTRDTA